MTLEKLLPLAVALTLLAETNLAEFANSVDLDEVAHYEPPHLDLHCLPFLNSRHYVV